MVSFKQFSEIDLRVGIIVSVEEMEGARKPMYKLRVDLGEMGSRNIAAGIKERYSKEELLGKAIVVVANLDPKHIGDFVSEGMLLAAEDDSAVSIITPDRSLKPGSIIR